MSETALSQFLPFLLTLANPASSDDLLRERLAGLVSFSGGEQGCLVLPCEVGAFADGQVGYRRFLSGEGFLGSTGAECRCNLESGSHNTAGEAADEIPCSLACIADTGDGGGSFGWQVFDDKDQALAALVVSFRDAGNCGVFQQGLQRCSSFFTEAVHSRIDGLKCRAERSLLHAAFNNFPDALVIANASRKIIAANRAIQETFGYPAREVLGRTTEVFYVSREEFEEQGRQRYNLSAEEKRKPFLINYRRADGSIFPSETIGTVITLPDGTPAGFQGLMRDISERVLQEQTIARQHLLFEELVNNIPDMIVLADADRVITHVNESLLARTGFRREELIGESTSFIYASREDYIAAGAQRFRVNGGTRWGVPTTGTLRTSSGEVFPAEIRGGMLTDSKGNFLCMVGIFNDISLRIAYERSLIENNARLEKEVRLRTAQLEEEKGRAEAATRSKSRFLANMSHEIRTPLNGIIGQLQLLAEEHLAGGQREQVSLALECSNGLLDLINDILDLSRIEAGGIDIQMESFRLCDLLDGLAGMFAAQCRQKALQFRMNKEYIPGRSVLADRSRLRQIVINLVSNAIKFTDQGTVELQIAQVDTGGGGLQITVTDTGIGIAPENQEKIFLPFTQVDSSYKRRHAGSGLGLNIVSGLVEAMGGKIEVKSTPGEGTRMVCTIPCSWEDQQRDDRSSLLEQGSGKVTPRMILIAEDNRVNQITLRRMLEKMGHRVIVAANGREALQLLSPEYDLIFMDIQMPVMDGLEATEVIRAHHNTTISTIPIVALTAHAFREDREEAERAGVTDYLTKPVELGRLREVIAQLFEEREGSKAPPLGGA